MGDYDIKILTYDTHAATVEFVDMLYSHAFLPLINRPTRITQNSTTIIDNISTKNIGWMRSEWNFCDLRKVIIFHYFTLGKILK